MRTLTNNYRDSQVLNLGSEESSGPYLVTQTGVSPTAEIPKTRMFVLRPDGCWADFNAYVCQGKPEVLDQIVFPSIPNVMETFERLLGRPRVADLPIDEDGLKAWLEKQKTQHPLEAARTWAVEYKKRHSKQYGRLEDRHR
jgi:hypothetical protein